MNWQKPTLYLAILTISVVLSLLATYLYGAFFQHDRYWHGTIKRVEDTQVKFVEGILAANGSESLLLNNRENLSDLFDVLKGKLAVTVLEDQAVVYTNILERRQLAKDTITITQPESGLSIRIDRYEPPSWSYNYLAWLKRLPEWFSPRFDYITIPFIGLLLIFYAFTSALLWRYRSAHLSRDVLQLLKRIG